MDDDDDIYDAFIKWWEDTYTRDRHNTMFDAFVAGVEFGKVRDNGA